MNKNAKGKLLHIARKTLRYEAERNKNGKLSYCPVILHQPKRPKKK